MLIGLLSVENLHTFFFYLLVHPIPPPQKEERERGKEGLANIVQLHTMG